MPSGAWRAVVSVVILVACGGPREEGPCSGRGFVCASSLTALECVSNQWRAVPCRGPLGCAETATRVNCDVRDARPADPCLSTHAGAAACTVGTTAETSTYMSCQASTGTWVNYPTCINCRLQNNQVLSDCPDAG